MGIEIERKFLVRDDSWRDVVESETGIVQGYLIADTQLTLRVRQSGERAFLTLKGATMGISRAEFEYPIPAADAATLLRELALPGLIEKTRYQVRCGEQLWDLDVFGGNNQGLVLAEIELATEDSHFEMPGWVGTEVSDDPRYYNANLARHPFREWSRPLETVTG